MTIYAIAATQSLQPQRHWRVPTRTHPRPHCRRRSRRPPPSPPARAAIHVRVLEKEADTGTAPRACGYYGASHFALEKAGVYHLLRRAGFMTHGLCWRKLPADVDGTGRHKKLGEAIASLPFAAEGDTTYAAGAGQLNLPQSQFTRLLLGECLGTGRVEVLFRHELKAIRDEDGEEAVHVVARDASTEEDESFT
ncbi:hypothetical protein PG994_013673 [Apiospora phragmitis]|uniref:FAD-binding domain-containing protein n=1 Tax=Apiospora phragmitis TaxID=2905665 RepID=A0ABR1TB48_9PEZI